MREWTVEIRDVTPLVHSLRRLPRERHYPVSKAIARRLGMDWRGARPSP